MKENTNRAIAGNALILYAKMGINTVCALLTTRFALQALGVVDYGLYSVLGSIISFIGILNTIMVSSSNRFIAVALGKGDNIEVNKQFNVCLSIHLLIALIALILALPVGEWYIHRYINYSGDINNASMVFSISIIGSIISFIGVPYNGLLMAKEKFMVFSFADVLSHIVRLCIAYLLVNHFNHKLFVYTVTLAAMTAMPTLIYIFYCRKKYSELVRIKFVREKVRYKEIFGFSSWVALGAVATVGKNQGASLLVNLFFSTVMNAAMGIASTVNGYVGLFAHNITQPMEPQITKSYVAGNIHRTEELMIMSTKYCFLLTLLLGSLFIICPDWLLSLWLRDVPPYASTFLVLFIIDNVVQSLNSGVKNIIFANGNIKLYQLSGTLINLMSVIIAYFVLSLGGPAYSLVIVYICMSVIRFFVYQWVLHRVLNYKNRDLWKHSYLPSFSIVLLFTPSVLIINNIHPCIKLLICLTYLIGLEWGLGLNKQEKKNIKAFVQNRVIGVLKFK